jgi:hypothetical protein
MIQPERTWTSAAQAIYGAIRMAGNQELTLTDVMGLTAHAFRICIHPENVNAAGPTRHSFGVYIKRSILNLGFTSTAYLPFAHFKPPAPEHSVHAIRLIQDSIDRSTPVISWDLFTPEFGIIYGYDDEKRVFYAKDKASDGELAYEQLGRGATSQIFVLALKQYTPLTTVDALRGMLSMVIHHAYGNEVGLPGFSTGLKAFDAWIAAFSGGKVEESGNAYNVAVINDARQYAIHFLRQLPVYGMMPDISYILEVVHRVIPIYDAIAKLFAELAVLFPYPNGGEPNNPVYANQAIELLKKISELEIKGINQLEQIYWEI